MRRIAILDTGVGASEDDFVKLHVKKSFDFTTPKFSESNIGLDDNGHGTGKRYKKRSYDWYKKVIASNGEELSIEK